DILVNNAAEPAGQAAPRRPQDITRDQLETQINVKVMGYLRCARAFAPGMVANKWGRIINISGLGARRSGDTVASIRNAGVVALSKNLADEFGPSGINVNLVHPGMTRTEKVDAIIAARAAAEKRTPRETEGAMAGNLLGR